MGMFDSVLFKCPECGEEIEVQSKRGECILKTFNSAKVPNIIASDILDNMVFCIKCQTSYQILEAVSKKEFISLDLFKE